MLNSIKYFLTLLISLTAGCATHHCSEDLVGKDYLKRLKESGSTPEFNVKKTETKAKKDSTRKIVMFIDGTGDTPDSKTNIWQLYDLAKKWNCANKNDNTENVLEYFQGVGTTFGTRITGSAFGVGVGDRIRKAYMFLVRNYQIGDKVYLFGFSRGAFIARSFNGFIDFAGVLKSSDYPTYSELQLKTKRLYKLYTRKNDGLPDFELRLRKDIICQTKDLSIYRDPEKVMIDAIGVFDTVPALGIDRDDNPDSHRTNLYALEGFHALSIDEQRDDFRLLRFNPRPPHSKNLKEVWFAGVHGDIGGNYDIEDKLGNITLDWMLKKFSKFGIFPSTSKQPTETLKESVKTAVLHDEFLKSKFFRALGISWRKPKENDYLHRSVVERSSPDLLLCFPSLREPGGKYSPRNLLPTPENIYEIEEWDSAE